MSADFSNTFADFLEERLGKALFNLRAKNDDYRKLSDEYAALLNGQHQSVKEYRQVISRIAAICQKLNDIEKHYLFLAGMREHANIEDTISSGDFEKMFAETE